MAEKTFPSGIELLIMLSEHDLISVAPATSPWRAG
jgi:hypothetical protein